MTDLDCIAASGAAAVGECWPDMCDDAREIYRRQAVGVVAGIWSLAQQDEATAGAVVNQLRDRPAAKIIPLRRSTSLDELPEIG